MENQIRLKDKYLKYGDLIYLKTNDTSQLYIFGRSRVEENIYSLSSTIEQGQIDDYPNPAELIFQIHPKLYYQTYKKYLRLKNSEHDPSKLRVIEQRMEAETELNEKRVKSFMEQYVRIGDQVQLYHHYSQSYIKATNEINNKDPILLNLKLTQIVTSSVQFIIKINPFMNFKKYGEKISYEDSFYFQHYKQKTVLTVGKFVREIKQAETSDSQSQKKNQFQNPNQNLNIPKMSCIENLSNYSQHSTGHTKDKIQVFQAQFLYSMKAKELNATTNNYVFYGDYVKLKNITSSTKTGQLYSEINITGFFPKIYLATNASKVEKNIIQNNDFHSSIFQILPSVDYSNLIGKQVRFEKKEYQCGVVVARFRHAISGRYLKFDMQKQTICLSENVEPLCKQIQDIQSKQKKNSIDEKLMQELKQLTQIYKDTEINVINSSIEEDTLSFTSMIQFQSKDKTKFLKVENKEEVFIPANENYQNIQLLDAEFYKNIYANLKPLGRDDSKTNIVNSNGDYFFLAIASDSEISDIMTVMSCVYTFLQIEDIKNQDNEIQQAYQMLLRLGFWMCNQNLENIQLDSIDRLSQIDNPVRDRQNLLRESGLLDIQLNLLIHIYKNPKKYLDTNQCEERQEIMMLIMTQIEFFKLATQNSYVNCVYLLQWYSLFKQIILDSNIHGIFRFDLLLNDIICFSSMNFSFNHDITPIAQAIKFEDYNIRAINLLTGFCAFNEFTDNSQNILISEALFKQESVRDNIFRQLQMDDDQNIYLKLTESQNLIIDQDIGDKEVEQETIEASINLAIEIAKRGDSNSLNHIRNLYTFDICKIGFQKENIPFQFRALFLELLIECYIKIDSKFHEDLQYPELIQMKGEIEAKMNQEYQQLIENKNKMFYSKYFIADFNIKQILIQFLQLIQDPYTSKMKHQSLKVGLDAFLLSVFQLCKLLIVKGFYEVNEALELKKLIYGVVSFAYHQQFKTENQNKTLFPDKKISKWIILATDCMQNIEYIQNHKIIQIFYIKFGKEFDLFFKSEEKNEIESDIIKTQLIEKKNIQQKQKLIQTVKEYLDEVLNTKEDQLTMDMHNWMQFQNQELNGKIINYVDYYFSFKTNFYYSINQILPIDEKNIELYQNFQSNYQNLHYYLSQFMIQNDPDIQFENIEQLCVLINSLKQLLFSDDQQALFQQQLNKMQQEDVIVIDDIYAVQQSPQLNSIESNDRRSVLERINPIESTSQKKVLHKKKFNYKLRDDIELQDKNSKKLQKIDNNDQPPKSEDDDMGSQQQILNDQIEQVVINEIIDEKIPTIVNNPSEIQQESPIEQYKQMSNPFQGVKSNRFEQLQEQQKEITKNLKHKNQKKHTQTLPIDIKQKENKNFFKDIQSKMQLLWRKPHEQQNQEQKQSKPVFQKILEHQVLINDLKESQLFLRNLRFDEILINIIDFLVLKFSIRDKLKLEIRNKVICDSVYCLIFFILKNNENKQQLLGKVKLTNVINHLISQSEIKFLVLCFSLLHNSYENNYQILLNLNENLHLKQITQQLVKLIRRLQDIKTNKALYFIYLFDILNDFFILNNKNLIQNQTYIVELLNENLPQNFLKQCIIKFLQEVKLMKLIKNNDNQFQNTQEVKPEILAILILFKTLRQIAKNGTVYIVNYIKNFLNIDEIIKILQDSSDFYPLKMELALFTTEVYINNNKLEPNELRKLEKVFSIFLNNLQEFTLKLRIKQSYQNVVYTTNIENIFERDEPYSSKDYLINIKYFTALEQYIIFGIFRSYKLYQDKLSADLITDTEIGMISKFSEYIDALKNYWLQYDQFISTFEEKVKQLEQNRRQSKLSKEQIMASPVANSNKQTQPVSTLKTVRLEKQFEQKLLNQQIIFEIFQQENVQKLLFHLSSNEGYKEIQSAFENHQYQTSRQHFSKEFIKQIEMSSRNQYFQNILKIQSDGNNNQFLSLIKNYIYILSQSEREGVMASSKSKSLKILRKITNHSSISETSSWNYNLEFLQFLAKIIVDKESENMMEYVKSLNDLLEDNSGQVHDCLYDLLLNDKQNQFILKLRHLLNDNFKRFRDYSKQQNYIIQKQSSNFLEKQQNCLLNFNCQQNVIDLQNNVNKEFLNIINEKQKNCKEILELFRLCCENHYSNLQNFLRIQINDNQLQKSHSINMIRLISELFCKYSKLMNIDNLDLGIKFLEALIEFMQGPCKQNQQEIMSTKILEYMEDILYAIDLKDDNNSKSFLANQSVSKIGSGITLKLKDAKVSLFHERILLLLLSMFDGNNDQLILNKIQLYIHPSLLLNICQNSFDEYLSITIQIKSIKRALKFHLANYQNQEYKIQTLKYLSNLDINDEQLIRTQFSPDNILYEKALITLNEGIKGYILLQNLAFLNSSFNEKYTAYMSMNLEEKPKRKKALHFYRENCLSIEIVNQQNQLQKIFFQRPQITYYLSSSTQMNFLERVDRSSSNEKIQGIYDNVQLFFDEMNHYLFLSVYGLLLNLNALIIFRSTNLLLIFVQNILILSQIFDSGNLSDIEQKTPVIFGFIQLVFAVIIWSLFVMMELPIQYMRFSRQHEEQCEKFKGKIPFFNNKFFYLTNKLCLGTHFFYLSYNIIISLCGLYISKIFYSLLLLDIVDRSSVLVNVIKSITQNAFQLIMTAVLGIVIVYIYAIIAFYVKSINETFIYTSYPDYNICNSAWNCFTFMMNIGLRSGGGIGDQLELPNPQQDSDGKYVQRYFYDLSFFVLMIIIWMNIVFGIIIDTFAELRDAKKSKDEDQTNICFICNKQRDQFENENQNFSSHIQNEHNTWNYLYFLIHLMTKEKNEYDGTESYIFEQYQNKEISWFPVGKAMSLASQMMEEDEIKKIDDKLEVLQSNMQILEKQIN